MKIETSRAREVILTAVMIGAIAIVRIASAQTPSTKMPAINANTNVVARESLSAIETPLLERLNLWMKFYDEDPRRMCEELYTEDTNVWMPDRGTWFRNRTTWTQVEIGLFNRAPAPRKSQLDTVILRDNIAAVENIAAGWAALLTFDPQEQRIFLDRTYSAGGVLGKPGTISASTTDLVSVGSLPRASTPGSGGATEGRESVKAGRARAKAFGTRIVGLGRFTAEEQRNLEAALNWQKLYNMGGGRIAELYADKIDVTEVAKPGRIYRDKERWKAVDAAIAHTFPKRQVQLIAIVPRGNIVAVEAVTSFTSDHEEWWYAFLTLANGKITVERRYDDTEFKADSEIGKMIAAATK